MSLYLKIISLLWLVNFAPPLLACVFEDKWSAPFDRNRCFSDGRPVFGSHKTLRGVFAGILMGLAAGTALGFPWWIGLSTGLLSMAGDLLSSFIKRRFEAPSGSVVPGLDQIFEGAFPFIVLGPYFSLGFWSVASLVVLFGSGAYTGSWFFNKILLKKPFEAYPRPVRPGVRLREFRSCQVESAPLRYLLNLEDSLYYNVFMKTVFRLIGVFELGKRNALKIEKSNLTFHFPDLPRAFDGYRILFFADLHLDGLEGLTDKVLSLVRGIRADLCIIGGDFRMETHGPFEKAVVHLRRVISEIRASDGVFGVLGNHDCLEIIEQLECDGIRFLVNDSCAVERNGEKLWLVGVDDPHYYRCHDLEQAFDNVPRGAFSILIAHSNEIYREASRYRPQLYLCGHTHAGQIQLPVVGPVFTHSKAPRSLSGGRWTHGDMLGYTTCGVGVSGVPVRFFSKGEVALITLARAPSADERDRIS